MIKPARVRLASGIFLTIILYFVAGVSASKLAPVLQPRPLLAAAGSTKPSITPFQPVITTATPFLPLHPTETALPQPTSSPARIPPVKHNPPYVFYGIDFSRSDAPVTIEILPPGGSNPIRMKFYTGAPCAFSDHRACVHAYTTPRGGNVILLSIHSGVGGEGEPFRQAVEGTWINSAAATPQQVETAITALIGAPITIHQEGAEAVEGLELASAARIPPANLLDYMNTPVLSALAAAAELKSELKPFVDPKNPIIVFEICGWQLPGEAWAPGVSPASASMYIGVIQDGS